MKRILIVTYYFAPHNNAGTFRALKLVKYLPEAGWTPLVLTCSRPLIGFRDDDLMNDIPAAARLWRCPALGLYNGLVTSANLLAKWRRALISTFLRNTNSRSTPSSQLGGQPTARGRIERLLCNLFIPDGMIDWIPFAAAWANWIIRRYQVDVVMTTSPPHSTHLLGAVLAQRSKLKWIVDLRDPWLENVVRNKMQAISKYRQAVESRMEKWIVCQADRVIANTETNRHNLLKRYPALSPKIVVIPNGFDTADLLQAPARDEEPKRFVATFSGYLYPGMAEPFFRVLEKLLHDNPALAQSLSVQIIGYASAYYQQQIGASNHGLAQVVQWLGPMSHRQTLAHLQRSDLLLCFNFPTPEAVGVVPSKLYEYFMMAKPILAIGPEGEAAAMIRRAKAGQSFAPDQEEEIAGALSNLLRRWQNGAWRAGLNQEYVQRFDRRLLANKLAEMCEALCLNS